MVEPGRPHKLHALCMVVK